MRGQSQFTIDGIQSEGNYPNALGMEEIAVSAAGGDVEINSPGAAIALTIKSGGNTFRSLNNVAWQPESFSSNNVDDETAARGFTGNPNLLYVESHNDLGGPIMRDKLWFFVSYNYFKIDKVVSGIPQAIATDLGIFHEAPAKLTYKLSQADTLQAHYQWGYKYKPLRGLSATTPKESVLEQDSPYWTGKVQWQRVWSNRLFTDVRYGFHGFDWPMTPNVPFTESPPRLDTATNINAGAGWDAFDNKPFRPQGLLTATYYLPTANAGSHDLKFGGSYVMDIERTVINGNSGPIRYRDRAGFTDEIEMVDVGSREDLYDTWTGPDNRNEIITVFLQDRWSPSPNLTFLAGLRYDRQRGFYEPGKRAPVLSDIFPTRETEGYSFKPKHNFAPRLGVNYAFGGGKTVVKAFWGRFFNELTTVLANNSNPGGENYRIYKFNDVNGNRLYDGQSELGALVSARGGISTVIDEDFDPPYADEISSALEHQFWGESSVRVAYVRKMVRNEIGLTNAARLDQFTVPRTVLVPIQDFGGAVTGTQTFSVFDIPDALRGVVENVYGNWPDASYDYDTIQVGFNKRWPGGFFLQSSFDYQWRDELRGGTATQGDSRINITTSPLNTDPLGVGFFQNVRPDVAEPPADHQLAGAHRRPLRLQVRHRPGRELPRAERLRLHARGVGQPGQRRHGAVLLRRPRQPVLGHGADPRPAPRQDGGAGRPLPRRGDARRLQHPQQQRRVELQHHQRHAVQPDHRHAGSAGRAVGVQVRILEGGRLGSRGSGLGRKRCHAAWRAPSGARRFHLSRLCWTFGLAGADSS